jgi:hypothetical protein
VRRLWSRDHRFSLFCNSEYVLAHEGEDSSLSHDRTFHRGSNPREKENSKLKKYSDCLFSSSAPRGTCQARVPQTGGPWNVKPNNTVGFRRQLASRLERTHGCRSDRRRRPCRPGRHAGLAEIAEFSAKPTELLVARWKLAQPIIMCSLRISANHRRMGSEVVPPPRFRGSAWSSEGSTSHHPLFLVQKTLLSR